MSTERRLIYEKFIEPFLPLDEQTDEFGDDVEYGFHKKTFQGEHLKPTPYKGYYLSSNYTGLFPLTEANLPTRQNKLWVGHTNFRITGQDEDIIGSVDGIEGARTLTPYRFLFSVGFAFEQEAVKKNLSEALCPPRPAAKPAPTPVVMDALVRAGMSRFPCWKIVRLTNGRKDLVGGLTEEEVNARIQSRSDIEEVLETSTGAKSIG